MCGCFIFYMFLEILINDFFLDELDVDGEFESGYNIFLGVGIVMICVIMNGLLLLIYLDWGFCLVWVGDKVFMFINVCVESVVIFGYFWEVFVYYCCLILVNGWYEW